MTDRLPLVSAVIPTFNRREKLARFLNLFDRQSYPYLQIVVVDSNSSDGTPEMVRACFPTVSLISVSDRLFWTGATKAGIKFALDRGTDYILTINDDSTIDRDHVSKLVNLAQKYQLSILGNRIDYLEPKNRIWALGTSCEWGTDRILTIAYHNRSLDSLPPEIFDREIMAVETMPGNGVLIARAVFDTIGSYNDRFLPHYHADSELILRARRSGFEAYIAPNIVLYNDFSPTQKQISLSTLARWQYTFFHPKSHLMMLPIFYLIWQYCPLHLKLPTLFALIGRFKNMAIVDR
jgi:GT2 family glycosyltransferase